MRSRQSELRIDCPLPYDPFFDAMPVSHLDWFERLRLSQRTADCSCSHGGGEPEIKGRTIGIDTISHGVLTAVRMPGGDIFQSARYARRRS